MTLYTQSWSWAWIIPFTGTERDIGVGVQFLSESSEGCSRHTEALTLYTQGEGKRETPLVKKKALHHSCALDCLRTASIVVVDITFTCASIPTPWPPTVTASGGSGCT